VLFLYSSGEFGPDYSGSNHVMIRIMSFNAHIIVSIHKHTSILLVWSKKNFKVGGKTESTIDVYNDPKLCLKITLFMQILQEVTLCGIEGGETNATCVRVLDSSVVVWLEDGSIQEGIYSSSDAVEYVMSERIQRKHKDARIAPRRIVTSHFPPVSSV
jgi:hypothetical protein